MYPPFELLHRIANHSHYQLDLCVVFILFAQYKKKPPFTHEYRGLGVGGMKLHNR